MLRRLVDWEWAPMMAAGLLALLCIGGGLAYVHRPQSDVAHLRKWGHELGDMCGTTAVEPVTGNYLLGARTGDMVECDPTGMGGTIMVLHFAAEARLQSTLDGRDVRTSNACVDGRVLVIDGLEVGEPDSYGRFQNGAAQSGFKRWCQRFDGRYQPSVPPKAVGPRLDPSWVL